MLAVLEADQTAAAGHVWKTRRGVEILRLGMHRTHNSVYYEIKETRQEVWILSVWGGPRGTGPSL